MSGIILEFVVIGAIAVAVLVLPFGISGELLAAVPNLSTPSLAILAVITLLLLYFLGTITHFATWWWWRRVFHRRWFSTWIHSRSGKLYYPLAEEVFAERASSQSHAGISDAESRRRSGFIMDWCRFVLLESGSSELQVQYLRQFHLYRLAYGPLTAILVAFLLSAWFSVCGLVSDGPRLSMLVAPMLLLLAVLSIFGAHHRAGRMWKYLCYSASVISCSAPEVNKDDNA